VVAGSERPRSIKTFVDAGPGPNVIKLFTSVIY
jgi:hypothetical protein